MNNEHKLVQDLFPNYIDGLTSEETNKFIEEHISSCETCNQALEKMKTNIIENNHTNLNDKQIKFAKKINKKLKLLKLVLLIILIIIVGNFTRKFIILKKLEGFGNPYKNCNNSLVITSNFAHSTSSLNLFDVDIDYYFYKNGNSLYTSSWTQGYRLNDDIFPEQTISKSYCLNGTKYDFQYDMENNLESVLVDEEYGNYYTPTNEIRTYIDVKRLNENFLKVMLFSKIETVNFDNVEYYKITFDNVEYYFEKYTGLFRKYYGSYKNTDEDSYFSTEYTYLFNFVSDEVLELPEIPEELLKPDPINSGGDNYEE